MFDTEILILEFGGFFGGSAEKGLEAMGDHGASWGDARARNFGQAGDFRFKTLGQASGLRTEFFDEARNEAVRLGGERVEQVFDLDRRMSLLGGDGLSGGDSLLRVFG